MPGGELSALPHGSLQPQVIREGQMVLIDDGCTVEGYQSDISRSFVYGKATDKQKRVFDVVHRAQAAAIAAAGVGVACHAIDDGGTQGGDGCGAWAGLPDVYAPGGARDWDGWARVAVPGAGE